MPLYKPALTLCINALIFSTVLSAAPAWKWTTVIDGLGKDLAERIVVDSADNQYVAGRFEQSMTFGGDTLRGRGNADVFIAKINRAGRPLWAVSAGGGGDDIPYGAAVDAMGNVYVTGFYGDSALFGDSVLYSQGGRDVFLAKYGPSGAFLWVRSAGGPEDDCGYGAAVASNGLVFVTGRVGGKVQFDDTVLVPRGYADAFLLCYDTAGRIQWDALLGADTKAGGFGVAVDRIGNIYMTGYFGNSIADNYGVTYRTATAQFQSDDQDNLKSCDAFVARFDSVGKMSWFRPAGGNGYDEGRSIAVTDVGGVYVAGNFEGKAGFGGSIFTCGGTRYFCRNDSTGITGSGNGLSPVVFKEGEHGCSCTSGDFTPVTATFQCRDTSLVSSGGPDIFLARYDTGGTFLSAKSFGSSGYDEVRQCVVDKAGDVTLAGCFSKTITFGKHVLKSRGLWDGFLVRVAPRGRCRWALQAGGSDGNDDIAGLTQGKSGLFVCGSFSGTAVLGMHVRMRGAGKENGFAAGISDK